VSTAPDSGDVDLGFSELAPRDRYKLLIATVVPRPIALVTTLGEGGVVNAAPFSFFNVFSEEPALVVLGLQHKPDRSRKDTTRNIAEAGSFVVHLVDEDLAEAMNVCAIDFAPGISEVEMAGLTLRPSVEVEVPRIAEAPFALECRRHTSLVFGPERELLIGEVVHLHARAGLLDPATMRVDTQAYKPIGRLHGSSYARQGDRFEMRRETPEDFAMRRSGAKTDRQA
jgi:flavin reductase (DIM6/NTAB) family NADH-FMN oxidoreductase RutF